MAYYNMPCGTIQAAADQARGRVEVLQEQFGHDLHAVAEGVTGNAERLDRLGGRFDRFEAKFDHLSASLTASYTDHGQRLRALED